MKTIVAYKCDSCNSIYEDRGAALSCCVELEVVENNDIQNICTHPVIEHLSLTDKDDNDMRCRICGLRGNKSIFE